MSDLEDFEALITDINETLEDISGKLAEMRSKGTDENAKLRKDIHKLISDAEKSLNRFQDDLATVTQSDDRETLQKRFNKFNKILQDYKTEFQNLKDGKKPAPVSDEPETRQIKKKTGNDANGDKPQLQAYQTGMNDKLDEAVAMSNATVDILSKTRTMNEETIEIGKESLARLAKQREKMQKIQERLDDIGTNTKRAKKELNAFLRGVACDKCIIIVIIIIILLAAGFIIAKIICAALKIDCLSVDFAKGLISQVQSKPQAASS